MVEPRREEKTLLGEPSFRDPMLDIEELDVDVLARTNNSTTHYVACCLKFSERDASRRQVTPESVRCEARPRLRRRFEEIAASYQID